MKLFSQRKGLKPVKTVIQVDSMDAELRNSLWNLLQIHYWQGVRFNDFPEGTYHGHTRTISVLCRRIWMDYFKEPLDTVPQRWNQVYGHLRDYFFSCCWNEVYDLIEFISRMCSEEIVNIGFRDDSNVILEREVSGYRFVSGRIGPITSNEEISEIEEATNASDSLKPAATHLKTALDFLADRKSPDYRNSIKESISAVEAACKLLAGLPKADLTDALRELKKKVTVHPALEKAFVSMYGYTSDEHGIRHALLDESTLGFEDAKFMLVSCAAFVNYLRAKIARFGLRI